MICHFVKNDLQKVVAIMVLLTVFWHPQHVVHADVYEAVVPRSMYSHTIYDIWYILIDREKPNEVNVKAYSI